MCLLGIMGEREGGKGCDASLTRKTPWSQGHTLASQFAVATTRDAAALPLCHTSHHIGDHWRQM